jgi:uncharacterized protein RhaS with RHS repeats
MVLLLVLTVGSLLNFSAGSVDQSAPFGFSWGPVDKIPRPSTAAREGNVTLLVYQRDQLFLTELRDTEEIVLEVCKKEGLQQIVWISRLLSAAEEHDKFEAILAEGMRRYGKPETSARPPRLRYTSRLKREADFSLLHHGAPRCDGCYIRRQTCESQPARA